MNNNWAGRVQIDAWRQNAGSPLWLRPGQTPGHERSQSGESWEHLWLVLCATQAALPALSNNHMPAGATTLTRADPTQASLGCLACPFLSSQHSSPAGIRPPPLSQLQPSLGAHTQGAAPREHRATTQEPCSWAVRPPQPPGPARPVRGGMGKERQAPVAHSWPVRLPLLR